MVFRYARFDAGCGNDSAPLGQGFGNGMGMAIAEGIFAAPVNRPRMEIIDRALWVGQRRRPDGGRGSEAATRRAIETRQADLPLLVRTHLGYGSPWKQV